ncbi:unnamed protein product [Allacma fusca]|uniref:Armadillo repeat-containing protein 8 n=1 Tax=Allacma fusca TaxID=39272 RepID=A0A8J2JQA3_9HEXA|nr:unnamed protein product [Allacma fusca]
MSVDILHCPPEVTSAMDVEETPSHITNLYTDNPSKCLDAVKKLKNAVIGSNRQKNLALRQGVLPRILELLTDNSVDKEIRQEACIILGSLVKGTIENVREVVDANAVPTLIGVLSNDDEKLVEYTLNCLTTIFSHSFTPRDIIYVVHDLIIRLLTLMNHSVANQISVATILSHCCITSEHQFILAALGVVEHVAALLASTSTKVQMPAITCLTAMAYKNENVSSVIAKTRHGDMFVQDMLVTLIGRNKPYQMQLTVARCLTYLHRGNALAATDPKIQMKTLPCLVRMCSKEFGLETRIIAAETLAYLIEVDQELQSIAAISNHLIPTLAEYLKCQPLLLKPLMGSNIEMIQAAFLAFASLASNDEHIRKRIIDTENLMERVVTGLDDPNESVALAAVRCLHSLSRSVHQLRTTFKDHSVYKPLMKLLQHPNNDILNVASSTLCNLLLEFSPSKEPILEAGAVEILCSLTRHEDVGLRLNGIWALMNVAFQADQRVKSQILRTLGTDQIFRLLSDSTTRVVMKTLGLLRNLISAPHIDEIMELYGKQIMQATILILEGDHEPDVKEQALCMLSNISDGVAAKEFIMTNEDVLKKITSYLAHSNHKLVTAAVLCVSHLAWKDEDGATDRQAKLKEMGVQKLLHQLITSADAALFERVKTALNQFSPN